MVWQELGDSENAVQYLQLLRKYWEDDVHEVKIILSRRVLEIRECNSCQGESQRNYFFEIGTEGNRKVFKKLISETYVLKIFFSNYDEIFLKNFKKEAGISFSANEDGSEEYYISNPLLNRYKCDLTISHSKHVNPPSECIIITGLKREACNIDILSSFLQRVGPILRSKYIL